MENMKHETYPAVCHRCLGVRNLSHGNPRAHNTECNCQRITRVFVGADEKLGDAIQRVREMIIVGYLEKDSVKAQSKNWHIYYRPTLT